MTLVFLVFLRSHRAPAKPLPNGTAGLNRFELEILNYYELLGVAKEQSDKEIKARFKELAKVFHTDRLASQDLPREVLELSEERFREIQSAYDRIRDVRGF